MSSDSSSIAPVDSPILNYGGIALIHCHWRVSGDLYGRRRVFMIGLVISFPQMVMHYKGTGPLIDPSKVNIDIPQLELPPFDRPLLHSELASPPNFGVSLA